MTSDDSSRTTLNFGRRSWFTTFQRVSGLLLILFALGACGEREMIEVPTEPSLTVLAEGNEPFTMLRYEFAQGDKATWKMSMKMDMEMKLDGQGVGPMSFPTTQMFVDAQVTSVATDGSATVSFVFSRIEFLDDGRLESAAETAYKDTILTMVGMTGEQVMDTQGNVTATRYDMPEGIDQQIAKQIEQMTQSMEQLAMPLPDTPVGIGASWVHVVPVEQNGLSIRQETTYTLQSLDDQGVVELDVRVTQAAPKQTSTIDGVKIKVLQFVTSGGGSATFPLRGVNVTSKSTVKNTSQFVDPASGQEIDMSMNFAIEITTLPVE